MQIDFVHMINRKHNPLHLQAQVPGLGPSPAPSPPGLGLMDFQSRIQMLVPASSKLLEMCVNLPKCSP